MLPLSVRSTFAGSLLRQTPVLLLACVCFLAACDSTPGPATPLGSPPVLSNFSFSPDTVVFETLPPAQRVNDTLAQVTVDLRVRADDADGDVDSVLYAVQAPFNLLRPVRTGVLSQDGGAYTTSFNLNLPRGGTGLYAILVYAVDAERQLSNQMRGFLSFEVQGGNPPVIEEIEGPDTFEPPGQLTLIAVVSDPDGLSNIRRVVVRTPNGQEFSMLDDGSTQGDVAAGDGRYTASFNVPSNVTPGVQTFSFQAFDRSGLTSEVVTKDVDVQ